MKVGPYEVLRKLGEGAYGKVYLARKGDASGFATWYALKRIARGHGRGPEFEGYLLREARLGGLVNHPNLVRVHEVLSLRKEWVLVQDYVDGVTLRGVLERRRHEDEPVSREVALEIAAELLDTLHHLHTLRDPEGRESGFIHRDVKPGNVMLSAGHLKVMDFGVARGSEAGAGTLAGELRGTLAYMAPEQATGAPVGPPSDQFAAGLILLEMLCNGSPWGDVRGPAVLSRVVMGDVSEGLARLDDDDPVTPLLLRMLAREPQSRYPSARDAARALRTLRAATPTPPALRDFCSDEVARGRDEEAEEIDEHPSWTGAWQWVSGSDGGALQLKEDAPVESPEPVVQADDVAPVPIAREDEERALDDDAIDLDALDGGGDELESDEELDLEPEPGSEGPEAVAAEFGAALTTLDDHRTLPLPTTPGQRAAMLRSLGLTGDGPDGVPPGGLGTSESLAAIQARLGDVDPLKTLPIGIRASGENLTPEVPVAPALVPPVTEGPRPGDPAQAGSVAHAAPGAQLAARKRKRKPASVPTVAPSVSVGAELWQQFARSPILGSGIALVLLVFIAGTVRIAWLSVQPDPIEDPEAVVGEDLDLPSVIAARAAPPVAPVASAASVADEPPMGDVAPEAPDSGDSIPAVESASPSVAITSPPVARTADPTPAPRPLGKGADLDADLAAWSSEPKVTRTGAPTTAPRPGEIIGGAKAGEKLLEESGDTRRVATRRGTQSAASETAAASAEPSPTPAPVPAATASLRFVSSDQQPATVPLSIRVRPDGFYAASVFVYYQWRGEGAAGRRRRELGRQGDGSFALELPVSEVRVDRLQLWFVADPGDVKLGTAGSPLEVRVR